MKLSFARILIAIFALFSATLTSLAQSEAQKLNARLTDLYQKGEVDAAVPIAEEIVAIERQNKPVSSANLTNSLENLSRIKLDRVKRSMTDLRSPELSPDAAAKSLRSMRQDAAETEAHLREAIEILRSGSKSSEQSANLLSNLGWLLYNYIPAESSETLGFDKESRDKIEMRQRARYQKRFNEARQLYSEAAKTAEAIDPGGRMDIAATFSLAEFETAMANFESALPLYAKLTANAEKLFGKNSPQLISLYEPYLKVLVASGQQDAAFDVLSKTVTVSKSSAQYPKTLLNLTHRAEKPFAPTNAKKIEDDSRALKARAELSGRGSVARVSATGADIVGTSLAVSTNAREFYETAAAKGVRMTKIVVKIELDENGKVISAEGLSQDRDLRDSAESAAKQWKFRPFLASGRSAKLKGYVEVSVLSN